jgi:hypothetical protein
MLWRHDAEMKTTATLEADAFNAARAMSFDLFSIRSLSGFKQRIGAYLMAPYRKHGLKQTTLERRLDNRDDSTSPVPHAI